MEQALLSYPDKPQSNFVQCAGYELHVMDWGPADGEAVVMWHGLARTGRDFDELAEALSDRYRIICPDTIGRGLSQWAKDREHDYTFDGTSMGALIGMKLAAGALKDRITHILINDIGPAIPEAAAERIASYVGNPPVFATLGEFEGWLRTVYAPFGTNPDSFWRTMTETSYRRLDDGRVTVHYDPRIVSQLAARGSDLDLWPDFEAITCPILLLCGAKSDVLPAATAEEMVRRNSRTKLMVAEGYGHAPPMNTPEHIALVREFLGS
jgi:pimeloyl-ACP methyl ester carboxylesterase